MESLNIISDQSSDESSRKDSQCSEAKQLSDDSTSDIVHNVNDISTSLSREMSLDSNSNDKNNGNPFVLEESNDPVDNSNSQSNESSDQDLKSTIFNQDESSESSSNGSSSSSSKMSESKVTEIGEVEENKSLDSEYSKPNVQKHFVPGPSLSDENSFSFPSLGNEADPDNIKLENFADSSQEDAESRNCDNSCLVPSDVPDSGMVQDDSASESKDSTFIGQDGCVDDNQEIRGAIAAADISDTRSSLDDENMEIDDPIKMENTKHTESLSSESWQLSENSSDINDDVHMEVENEDIQENENDIQEEKGSNNVLNESEIVEKEMSDGSQNIEENVNEDIENEIEDIENDDSDDQNIKKNTYEDNGNEIENEGDNMENEKNVGVEAIVKGKNEDDIIKNISNIEQNELENLSDEQKLVHDLEEKSHNKCEGIDSESAKRILSSQLDEAKKTDECEVQSGKAEIMEMKEETSSIEHGDSGSLKMNIQDSLGMITSIIARVPDVFEKEGNTELPVADEDSVKYVESAISIPLNSEHKTVEIEGGTLPSCSYQHVDLDDKETGFPEAFKGLVKIGRFVSVKGDFTLRNSDALLESPSFLAPFLLKEPDCFPERAESYEPKEYFQSSVGKFLVDLGKTRVNEWYMRDMVRWQQYQIKKEGPLPEFEEDLKLYQDKYMDAKAENKLHHFRMKTCRRCNFTTESDVVLEGHFLIPHVTPRREYECNFCAYLNRSPKEILAHMKLTHNKIGFIEISASSVFQCSNCMFDSYSRPKLLNHLIRCEKYFNPSIVQIPPKDFEFPCLTPKAITVAVVKSYEKNPLPSTKKRKIRKINIIPFNNIKCQSEVSSQIPYEINALNNTVPKIQQVNSYPYLPINMAGNMNHQGRITYSANYRSSNAVIRKPLDATYLQGLPQPPKLQGPYPMRPQLTSGVHSHQESNILLVCEICDGYIKNMEQLQIHMSRIHKLKIYPKMTTNRPPLNCQKCQDRFFTDHGLERHLLGTHGLVTTNMQEMANAGRDAGCCTMCGRVLANKILSHMSQVHKFLLRPANLSYKCTICSMTFNLYRLFESHVHLAHATSLKRHAENNDAPTPSKKPTPSYELENSNLSDKHLKIPAEKENTT